MAISLVRRLEPWWFTPDSQKDAAEPTRFLLGPLSRQSMLEIAFLVGSSNPPEDRARARWLALRAGLLGWENVKGADGRPAVFSTETASRLPTGLLAEIGWEIIERNSLAETEEKNSASPSRSANGLASSSAEDVTADADRTASGATPSPAAGPSRDSG